MTEKSPTQKRNERIWQTIGDIPHGKVASYGQVAAIAGIPRGARQAAYALRQLPRGHTLPWHRVITASGRIAFEVNTRPYREQVKRLKMEGVAVQKGRVDMRVYRWQPDLDELLWKPSAAWDER
jgi:methylated-DNA-protein-cysteine methyltransferase-like protein